MRVSAWSSWSAPRQGAVTDDAVRARADRTRGVIVVCDGVGSVSGSAQCADLVAALALDFLWSSSPRSFPIIGTHLQARVRRATDDGRLEPGAASTLAAAVVVRGRAWLITIGDSRAYLIGEESLVETSTPHSVAFEAVLGGGDWTPGSNNSITRSVAGESDCRPTILMAGIRSGDTVVVATDGVTEPLGGAGVVAVVLGNRRRHPGHDLARDLVEEASRVLGSLADDATAASLTLAGGRP